MSRSTKILIAAFGALVLYGVISGVVYPEWIQPLLTIDQRIAKSQKEYDELKALGERVERTSKEYETMLSRVGSFDVGKIETAVRVRLNELIEAHQLQSAKVSPSRPKTDRKTGLTTMQITVNAMGTLRAVTEFLKAMAELPQLARVGNVAIYPARRSRKSQERNRMNMRIPIEILVLPQQQVVGRFKEDELIQPKRFVRHEDRDYSLIWENKQFTERIPLKVNAGRDVNVKQGQQARLRAKPTGGEPPFIYSWDPEEGLSNADIANPTIDTSSPSSRTYGLTVVDIYGDTATDTIKVVIRESRRAPARAPEPPKIVKVDNRWPNRKYMQLRMTLLHDTDTQRVRELMVFDNRSKQAQYYAVGDEFDGGELVFVHPRGGIVRRKHGYYLYPIGTWLDQDIDAGSSSAGDCPELKGIADRLSEAAGASADAEREAVSAAAAGEPAKTTRDSTLSKKQDNKAGDTGHAQVKRTGPGSGLIRPKPSGQELELAGQTKRDAAGTATQKKSESAAKQQKPQPVAKKKKQKRRVRRMPRSP